jgi:hypothetical protein
MPRGTIHEHFHLDRLFRTDQGAEPAVLTGQGIDDIAFVEVQVDGIEAVPGGASRTRVRSSRAQRLAAAMTGTGECSPMSRLP